MFFLGSPVDLRGAEFQQLARLGPQHRGGFVYEMEKRRRVGSKLLDRAFHSTRNGPRESGVESVREARILNAPANAVVCIWAYEVPFVSPDGSYGRLDPLKDLNSPGAEVVKTPCGPGEGSSPLAFRMGQVGQVDVLQQMDRAELLAIPVTLTGNG